jgi:hypothetical protein
MERITQQGKKERKYMGQGADTLHLLLSYLRIGLKLTMNTGFRKLGNPSENDWLDDEKV